MADFNPLFELNWKIGLQSMFNSFLKKRALKQYLRKLPKALKANYGGSGKSGYTDGQVRATIKELNLNTKYTNYALLAFCGEQALHNESSETLLEMTKLLGTVASGGYAGISGPDNSSDGAFDNFGGDGGGE